MKKLLWIFSIALLSSVGAMAQSECTSAGYNTWLYGHTHDTGGTAHQSVCMDTSGNLVFIRSIFVANGSPVEIIGGPGSCPATTASSGELCWSSTKNRPAYSYNAANPVAGHGTSGTYSDVVLDVDIMNIQTAGQGWAIPLIGETYYAGSQDGTSGGGTANQVKCSQTMLHDPLVVGSITSEVTTLNAGTFYALGIYSLDGNTKLVDSGALSTAATGVFVTSITPVTLQPGFYYFCQTENSVTPVFRTMSVGATPMGAGVMNAASRQVQILAGNASASGVLPGTLGTLTNTSYTPFLVVFGR